MKRDTLALWLFVLFILLKCLLPPSAVLRDRVCAFLGAEERTVQAMLKNGG